jgi:hypothetical protein
MRTLGGSGSRRRRCGRWLAFLALRALGAAPLLGAQAAGLGAASPVPPAPAPAASTTSVPTDSRQSWAVGFSILEAVGVDPANLYLSYSIPLMLRERLLGIAQHALSDEERSIYRRDIVDGEIRTVSASLIKARRERDALAAAGTDTPRAARDVQKKVEQISLLTDRIRFLQALDLDLVDVAATKPVTFPAAGAAQGAGAAPASASGTVSSLLDAPRYSPLQTARAASADLLVFGSIEQVDEYLFLSIKAIDFPGGRIRLDLQDAFAATEVYGGMGGIADRLADIVLGRPWARLRVTPTPADAEVSVGGEFAAVGQALLPYAPTGEVEVLVSRQGYRADRRVVTLAAGDDLSVDVALEAMATPSISITSSPLLADVYLDSRWVGATPVEVPRPAGLERVEIRSAGYETHAFHLSPSAAEQTAVALRPHVFDLQASQKQARESFYRAAGAWVVSLPVPLYLWALSLDQVTAFTGAQQGGNLPAQYDLYVRYRRLYAGYLGGLFLNLSLFTNMIVELVRYIQASDRPAG